MVDVTKKQEAQQGRTAKEETMQCVKANLDEIRDTNAHDEK